MNVIITVYELRYEYKMYIHDIYGLSLRRHFIIHQSTYLKKKCLLRNYKPTTPPQCVRGPCLGFGPYRSHTGFAGPLYNNIVYCR